jgi:hypothetical protein
VPLYPLPSSPPCVHRRANHLPLPNRLPLPNHLPLPNSLPLPNHLPLPNRLPLQAGVLSEAALALEAEVQAHPDNADAWRLLGTVHAENDDDVRVGWAGWGRAGAGAGAGAGRGWRCC